MFPLKLNLNSFISNNKNGIEKDEALSEGFPEELFGSGSKCDDSSYTGTDSSSALDEIDQVNEIKFIYFYFLNIIKNPFIIYFLG